MLQGLMRDKTRTIRYPCSVAQTIGWHALAVNRHYELTHLGIIRRSASANTFRALRLVRSITHAQANRNSATYSGEVSAECKVSP